MSVYSIGAAAALLTERLGVRVETRHIRAAIQRGYLKEPQRCGIARAFLESDLPRVERALRLAGYLNEAVPA